MEGFRYDAHPMGMFVSVVAALSTFYPEANQVTDPANRLEQVHRLIAKVPTIAAFSYRHNLGQPYVYPENDLGFTANFLSMMFRMAEPRYAVEPGARARARGAVHPPRRPRAELLGERDALDRLEPRRPVLRARGRGGRPLRAAARRRQRGRAEDAQRDRRREERAGGDQAREGRRVPPDGLRPPRLQELRPAREDHQARPPTRCSRSPGATRCSTSRSSSRRSRSRTTTSSRGSCTRTSTSTPG